MVKVSRWDWNTLLKITFSARTILGIQWQSVRRDRNEGQFEERSLNEPTRLLPSCTGDKGFFFKVMYVISMRVCLKLSPVTSVSGCH